VAQPSFGAGRATAGDLESSLANRMRDLSTMDTRANLLQVRAMESNGKLTALAGRGSEALSARAQNGRSTLLAEARSQSREKSSNEFPGSASGHEISSRVPFRVALEIEKSANARQTDENAGEDWKDAKSIAVARDDRRTHRFHWLREAAFEDSPLSLPWAGSYGGRCFPVRRKMYERGGTNRLPDIAIHDARSPALLLTPLQTLCPPA
jgi:hypothetical protein